MDISLYIFFNLFCQLGFFVGWDDIVVFFVWYYFEEGMVLFDVLFWNFVQVSFLCEVLVEDFDWVEQVDELVL